MLITKHNCETATLGWELYRCLHILAHKHIWNDDAYVFYHQVITTEKKTATKFHANWDKFRNLHQMKLDSGKHLGIQDIHGMEK